MAIVLAQLRMATNYVTSDLDLWTDAARLDPYPLWEQLRELGPVVYLERHDLWALPRYAEVRTALQDWEQFSSAEGVMLNEPTNEVQKGQVVLCTDPPEHTRLREVLRRPLTPVALRDVEAEIEAEADGLVERLVQRGSFDAVHDLARYLPLTIVSTRVGLPDDARGQMLEWAAAAFECIGPMNARAQAAFPILSQALEYSNHPDLPDRVRPGSWAARLWEAAGNGEIPAARCPAMLADYWIPGLDTTILATASAIWLFGRHPDQWDLVRGDPAMIPHAINEVVRLESPISHFSRVATREVTFDDGVVPAGARVLVMYGSANRDPRRYPDPERFDVRRRPADQLGFGIGKHQCVGMPLARMEIRALLAALAKRVTRFELGEMQPALNNILHGIARLPVRLGSDGGLGQ